VVEDLRVEAACGQLEDSETDIKQIAYVCGCGDDRASLLVYEADLVHFPATMPEVGAIAIVHQGEDAAADRDARFARMAGLLPRDTEASDLGGLLDVERLGPRHPRPPQLDRSSNQRILIIATFLRRCHR
jgi:hypothetical protein